MKKLLLSIGALFVFVITHSQSRTILAGGNMGFAMFKNADVSTAPLPSFIESPVYTTNNTTEIEFNPFVGYQFNEKWAAGVTGSVNFYKEKNGTHEVKNTSYGFGPFVRYIHPLSDIFSLFGQLEGQYKTTEATNLRGLSTKIFPAVFINVKNGFGFNFDLGGVQYETSKYKNAQSNIRSSSFDFNFGRVFNIGISKNF